MKQYFEIESVVVFGFDKADIARILKEHLDSKGYTSIKVKEIGQPPLKADSISDEKVWLDAYNIANARWQPFQNMQDPSVDADGTLAEFKKRFRGQA